MLSMRNAHQAGCHRGKKQSLLSALPKIKRFTTEVTEDTEKEKKFSVNSVLSVVN